MALYATARAEAVAASDINADAEPILAAAVAAAEALAPADELVVDELDTVNVDVVEIKSVGVAVARSV